MKKLLIAILLSTSVCSASQQAEFGLLERDDSMPGKRFYSLWCKGVESQDEPCLISLDDDKPLVGTLRLGVHESSWVQVQAGQTVNFYWDQEQRQAVKNLMNSDQKIPAMWNAEKKSWRLEFPLPITESHPTESRLFVNIRKLK